MTTTWRHLPAAARPIAAAADSAVAAVRDRDEPALARAVDDLTTLDQAQVGLVLGTTVRVLLEDTHPGGIDGDDVRAVLEHCVRTAPPWPPGADPHVLLVLLASALGVLEDDGAPPPEPAALARNAALLLADLLGPRSMGDQLAAALREIERAQLND